MKVLIKWVDRVQEMEEWGSLPFI